jgi:hypothetical protein
VIDWVLYGQFLAVSFVSFLWGAIGDSRWRLGLGVLMGVLPVWFASL